MMRRSFNIIDNVAWYSDNSSSSTHPVATKQPNELGLYDMSGNVRELKSGDVEMMMGEGDFCKVE